MDAGARLDPRRPDRSERASQNGTESSAGTVWSSGTPGSSLEEGEEIPLENTVLAAPLDTFEDIPGPGWEPKEVYDAGTPAQLGGRTFAVSVLSAPTNDLGQVDYPYGPFKSPEKFVESDIGREMLSEQLEIITPADDDLGIEEVATGGQAPFTLMGQEISIGTFKTGLVNHDRAKLAGIHVAAAEVEETAVVIVGSYYWPTGTIDDLPSLPHDFGEQARKLLSEFVTRLEIIEGQSDDLPEPNPVKTPTDSVDTEEEQDDEETTEEEQGEVKEGTITVEKEEQGTETVNTTEPMVFTVSEQTYLDVEFEVTDGEPADLIMAPWDNGIDLPDNMRPEEWMRENSKEDVLFLDSRSGSGRIDMEPGAIC